jgi:hypothetical protein
MTTSKAERLVPALTVSARAQVQNSFQELFDSPETVYRSCLDMQAFQQEVLRVVLLDTRLRRITAVDVTKGTVNESLAHPREVFRAAIVHSAYALVVVHNLWVAAHKLCYVECGFMCGVTGKHLCMRPFIKSLIQSAAHNCYAFLRA